MFKGVAFLADETTLSKLLTSLLKRGLHQKERNLVPWEQILICLGSFLFQKAHGIQQIKQEVTKEIILHILDSLHFVTS